MTSRQTLEGIFDGDNGLLESTIFSTSYPLEPTHGGMNWHFIPRINAQKTLIDENPIIEQGDTSAMWAGLFQQLSSDPNLQTTLEEVYR
jgi:hypothetical protein